MLFTHEKKITEEQKTAAIRKIGEMIKAKRLKQFDELPKEGEKHNGK